MKITNEILKRIIKEEMDSTLKELVSGPGDFNNEPEITPLKWTALGKLLNWAPEQLEQTQIILNYFKNQNSRDWKAVNDELSSIFGERAEEIKTILRNKDKMQ